MALFLASLIILVAMLGEKLFFFVSEKQYGGSILGIFEIVVYIVILIFGIIFYIKEYSQSIKVKDRLIKKNPFTDKFNLLVAFFAAAAIGFIFFSSYLNFMKVSIHWDAVALYDARAKFLTNGMKFSDMPSLAKYDNLNKYYYLLYPPYTSIAHFVWESWSVTKQVPVSVYYSVVLLFLVLISFFVSKERFGLLIGVVVAFLVSSNNSIFNIVIKEYTNLPFDLYVVGGVLLLYSYLSKGGTWKYLFGVLMVAASLWVRLLEPIWFAVVFAFAISIFSKEKLLKSCFLTILFLLISLIEYYSWSYFTGTIAHNPSFLNFTKLNMIDTFVAIFTGAPLIVITTVAKSWGIPFFVHLASIIGLVLQPKYVIKNKSLLFLGLTVFISVAVYFSEFYVLSFQADWWSIVAMSLDRSSTFMIPISIFILFDLIMSSNFLKKR